MIWYDATLVYLLTRTLPYKLLNPWESTDSNESTKQVGSQV